MPMEENGTFQRKYFIIRSYKMEPASEHGLHRSRCEKVGHKWKVEMTLRLGK
jgi:hypothetical protein